MREWRSIAHGMNNTNLMLPLGRWIAAEKAYIRETLDLIASSVQHDGEWNVHLLEQPTNPRVAPLDRARGRRELHSPAPRRSPATASRPRRPSSCARGAGPCRSTTGVRPTGWWISERLFQRRHHAGDRRRGHHLHHRSDRFRHRFALKDAGRPADPAALSGRRG